MKRGFLLTSTSKKGSNSELSKARSELQLKQIQDTYLEAVENISINTNKAGELFNNNAKNIAYFILEKQCELSELTAEDRNKIQLFLRRPENLEIFKYFHIGLSWIAFHFDRHDTPTSNQSCCCQLCYRFTKVKWSHIIQRSVHEKAEGKAYHQHTETRTTYIAWWLLCDHCECLLNSNYETHWGKMYHEYNLNDIDSFVVGDSSFIPQKTMYKLCCSLAWRTYVVEFAGQYLLHDHLSSYLTVLQNHWFVFRDIFYDTKELSMIGKFPRVYARYFHPEDDYELYSWFHSRLGSVNPSVYLFGSISFQGWICFFTSPPLDNSEHIRNCQENCGTVYSIEPNDDPFSIPPPTSRDVLKDHLLHLPIVRTFNMLREDRQIFMSSKNIHNPLHVSEVKDYPNDDFSVSWEGRQSYTNLPQNWYFCVPTKDKLFGSFSLPHQNTHRCLYAKVFPNANPRFVYRFSIFLNTQRNGIYFLVHELAAEMFLLHHSNCDADMYAAVFTTVENGEVKPPKYPKMRFSTLEGQVDEEKWVNLHHNFLSARFNQAKSEISDSAFISFPPSGWGDLTIPPDVEINDSKPAQIRRP